VTTSTRPRGPGADGTSRERSARDRATPTPPERRPRLRGPAWLDGPMTSSHLVLGSAGLLLAIGLVMVFSASSIEAALDDEPAWAPGVKQLIWAVLGVVAMLVALRLPTGLIRRWAPIALVVVAAMLLLVLVPGIGVKLNGARQWFDLGFALLQPSEIAKLVFALWGAHVLALRERYLTTTSLLVPVLPVFAVLALLVIAEPDFGGVVTLGLVLIGLLWAGGMPVRWFAWAVAGGAVLLALVVAISPERMTRLTSFLDPFADPTDAGFQAIRGLYALANGGFWGVGLGNSAMKWNLLPEAESDFIFAIIGEELGFLGCLVVVTLYGVLAWAGFRIARRSADRFIQLASVAITVWLIGQAAMNMGYVVGLLPVTGVTLPLISAGGTSLILTLFIIGLLARFARSEPAAIEAQRRRTRGRIARLLLPVPSAAVEPVRPRRRPEDRAPARPVGGAGRTVVHTRSGPPRRVPPRTVPPEPAPDTGRRGQQPRVVPPRERRPAAGGGGARRQPPPPGTARRSGGQR
jgi:cell division protein FtsW